MRLRIAHPLVAAASLWLAGCSTLPSTQYPAFEEHDVEARYEFGDGALRRFQVPFSRPELTVFELHTDQGRLPESFEDGRRWLHAPDDAGSVTVRCRYRVYAADDEPVLPEPAELFPGAARIRVLQ